MCSLSLLAHTHTQDWESDYASFVCERIEIIKCRINQHENNNAQASLFKKLIKKKTFKKERKKTEKKKELESTGHDSHKKDKKKRGKGLPETQ